jgi:hypothetical protein
MEKLIELLNEYYKEEWDIFRAIQHNDRIKVFELENDDLVRDTAIISKQYWFIKWLVEKNKIDFSLIPNKITEIWIPMKINWEIKYGFDSSDYYWLLMLLSISDTPIDDLISYLR